MTEHIVHLVLREIGPTEPHERRNVEYRNHSADAALDFYEAAKTAYRDQSTGFVRANFGITDHIIVEGWTIDPLPRRDIRQETREQETALATPKIKVLNTPIRDSLNATAQFISPANMPRKADPYKVGPPTNGRLAVGTPTGVVVGTQMPWDALLGEIDEILDFATGDHAEKSFYRMDLGTNEFYWIRYSDIVSVGTARHNSKTN